MNIGNGDSPQLDHYFPLPIANFTKIDLAAGQSTTASTRRILAIDKPQPISRFQLSCDAVGGELTCTVMPISYRNADQQYCDVASFCWPTLRQFQLAHGFYCDDSACYRSRDAYRATHNGQDPVDTALPGQPVGTFLTTITQAGPGTLRLGSVQIDPGVPVPLGTKLISDHGGGLVGDNGAGLVERLKRAGLIGQDGASLIGQDGASLIGQDGASIISDAGAGFTGGNGESSSGEGNIEPESINSGWFLVRDRNGNPATVTNTTNEDGTTTGKATVELDEASQAQLGDLRNGIVFALVVPDQLCPSGKPV